MLWSGNIFCTLSWDTIKDEVLLLKWGGALRFEYKGGTLLEKFMKRWDFLIKIKRGGVLKFEAKGGNLEAKFIKRRGLAWVKPH